MAAAGDVDACSLTTLQPTSKRLILVADRFSTVLRLPNARTSAEMSEQFRRAEHTSEDDQDVRDRVVVAELIISPVLLGLSPWLAVQVRALTMAPPAAARMVGIVAFIMFAASAVCLLANAFLRQAEHRCVTVPADAWEAEMWAASVSAVESSVNTMDSLSTALALSALGRLYDTLRDHYQTFTVNGTLILSQRRNAAASALQVADLCSQFNVAPTLPESASGAPIRTEGRPSHAAAS